MNRTFCLAFLHLLFPLMLAYCGHVAAAGAYDAVVDKAGTAIAGVKTYRSIAAALEAAPARGERPFVIYIREGRYYEKLTVTKPRITLVGENRDSTVLSYDVYAGQPMPGAKETTETWGTSRSATLTIRATDFRAENLTVENSFDYVANDAKADDDPGKFRGAQAVALLTGAGSDRAAFRKVRLSGYQDTLYVKTGRSLFFDSVIEGNVDFIFGAGQAVFLDSTIVTRARAKKTGNIGYVTAPSTDIGDKYGLVFLNCRLMKEIGVPANSTPLGRPWHPTTSFPDGRYADPNAIGASVFIRTYMDDHISREGWATMGGTSREGNGKRTIFRPEDARFFEYKSYGPGAVINTHRRQLSDKEANGYRIENILGDWDIPFDFKN